MKIDSTKIFACTVRGKKGEMIGLWISCFAFKGVFQVTKMAGAAGEKNWTQSEFMSGSSRITTTIRLRDIYDPKPQPSKAPVRIRPPAPRPPSAKVQDLKQSISSDPQTKAIMRGRAQSLPSSSERKRELRRAQVRFVDALGLDLEEVKVFRVQEHPLIPQHVMFWLLMNSELAFGKSPELSMPYFKPCFPEYMGAQPDFLKHLHSQSVCLDHVVCSEQGITGTIQVLNLAYEKEVRVHPVRAPKSAGSLSPLWMRREKRTWTRWKTHIKV